jgi:hypothetical protein
MHGRGGDDLMHGGPGVDTMIGGFGRDALNGGADFDDCSTDSTDRVPISSGCFGKEKETRPVKRWCGMRLPVKSAHG